MQYHEVVILKGKLNSVSLLQEKYPLCIPDESKFQRSAYSIVYLHVFN